MRILVLSHDVPAPVNRPGSPRLYYFCEELAKRHELFLALLSPGENEGAAPSGPAFEHLFRGVERLPPPPAKAGWLNRQRHRFFSEPFYSTRRLYPEYHRRMRERVARLAHENKADLIYVNGMPMSQYVPSSGFPLVADVCDCLSFFYRKSAAAQDGVFQKFRFLRESRALARWERFMAGLFELLIVISPADEEALRAAAPRARTLVVPNGVDAEYFAPVPGSPPNNGIVFTGVMSYLPNEDAVLYFTGEIFPRLKRQHPGAEFWAVGKDPSEKLRALGSREGVHVTGTVEDIRDYLAGARVFVSPLRYGAGMKNKILAALSMSRPVVATSVSLNGIEAVPERDVLVADSPEEFAAQIGRVLADGSLAARLGENGRELILRRYSWDAAFQILRPRLDRIGPPAD